MQADRNTVIRIDSVTSVLNEGVSEKSQLIDTEMVKKYSESFWCTSGINTKLKEIVIEFSFDEKKESFILKHIYDEGHGGTVNKLSDNKYEYRLQLRDPNEMIPWIRSFGECARVISSGGMQTEKVIVDDWKKAISKYESL